MNFNPKDYLCSYDRRNPSYCWEYEDNPGPRCFCDNCFTGRTRLAEALLETIEENQRLHNERE